MSLLFLLAFLGIGIEKLPVEEMTTEYFILWALFAIADALWFRGSSK